jgi:uncharacterized protein RhaS with RHS repeats
LSFNHLCIGGLYDFDTKFYRFGARDYDPTIGRWTTKDPIGFAGGNPMSYNDPTGLDRRICTRRINTKFTPIRLGPLRHDYIQFRNSAGQISTYSWGKDGMIDESKINTSTRSCGDWEKSSDKADEAAQRFASTLNDIMNYGVAPGFGDNYDCQEFTPDAFNYQRGK